MLAVVVVAAVILTQASAFPNVTLSVVEKETNQTNSSAIYIPTKPISPDSEAEEFSLKSVVVVSTDPPASSLGDGSNVTTNTVNILYSTVAVQNVSVSQNGSDTSGSKKASSLNLAIIPVLAGFVFITIVCIKCCNRVKADVVKERDYIEDGKPLFRVEPPESHPDYLSSIGSECNPYSTVTSGYNPYCSITSGYNPYNTVTTLMSNVSTVSETKDMGTMVKPRDLRRSMRYKRPLSVPDLDEMERGGDRLGDVIHEVEKLKQDTSCSPKASRTHRHYSPSSRCSPSNVHQSKRTPRSTLASKMVPAYRSDNVLGVTAGKTSSAVKEASRHLVAHRRQPDVKKSTAEECESLLGSTAAVDSTPECSSTDSSLVPELPTSTDNSTQSELPDDVVTIDSSPQSTPPRESSPHSEKNAILRSKLKNLSKPITRTVSFSDSAKLNKGDNCKGRQPREVSVESSPPNKVEIARSSNTQNARRKFSLSKVRDADLQVLTALGTTGPSGTVSVVTSEDQPENKPESGHDRDTPLEKLSPEIDQNSSETTIANGVPQLNSVIQQSVLSN